MKIHFCDLCNESVPQSDLDEGRAYFRKGRVVCATCDKAMSHPSHGPGPHAGHAPGSAPAGSEDPEFAASSSPALGAAVAEPRPGFEHASPSAPLPASGAGFGAAAGMASPAGATGAAARERARSGGSSGVWIGIVALVFAAGAVAVLNERTRKLSYDAARMSAELQRRTQTMGELERSASDLATSVRGLEQQLVARLDEQRQRSDGALAELRAQAGTLAAQQQTLAQDLARLREDAGGGRNEIERKADALAQRIAKGEDERRDLSEKLAKLEDQAKKAPTGPSSPGSGAAAGASATPAAPSWNALVADLASAKAATRWEAVDQLGQSRDAQVVPYLLPMLKDPDVFVRMATARVLGDLNSTTAVPNLIDALEDGEPAVREAALGSLRVITGKDIRFDALATEAERAKKVKAWRDYWKKVEEEGGGGGAGKGG